MKINLDLSAFWKGYIDIKKVEKKYKVKFVCETPIKDRGAWREYPSLIFYGEKHPQGSNYMALSVILNYDGKADMVVSDGISGCILAPGVVDTITDTINSICCQKTSLDIVKL